MNKNNLEALIEKELDIKGLLLIALIMISISIFIFLFLLPIKKSCTYQQIKLGKVIEIFYGPEGNISGSGASIFGFGGLSIGGHIKQDRLVIVEDDNGARSRRSSLTGLGGEYDELVPKCKWKPIFEL